MFNIKCLTSKKPDIEIKFKTMKKIIYLLLIILASSCGNSKFKFHDNQVIAHRGAWKEAGLPENSIASLKHAIELGCHGSEFDVHMTKDDSLVVNHDRDFMGLVIESSTYEELLAKKHSNGEPIPTVREYLKAGMDQHRTKLIYEIKKSSQGKERSLELTRKSVELVKELGAHKWVEYICFDYDVGKLIVEMDPDAKVAYLNGDVPPQQAKNDGYTGLDYHYKVYKEHPEWIKEAHDIGLTINAWTVNDADEMRNLLDQKAEYITTNEPELLLEILKEDNYNSAKK